MVLEFSSINAAIDPLNPVISTLYTILIISGYTTHFLVRELKDDFFLIALYINSQDLSAFI